MKAITIVSLFLYSLVVFQGNNAAYAQEKAAAPEAKEHHEQSPKWEKLEDVRVLRVWQFEDKDKFPQVTILRVTNSTYIKLLQDPQSLMEFVNKHKMFAKDVIKVGPWVSLSSVDKEQPPKCWVLTLLHGKLSTMLVSALPQIMPNKPDPECE
jgi:hypothetical protein